MQDVDLEVAQEKDNTNDVRSTAFSFCLVTSSMQDLPIVIKPY
jgi:hypothetical protein